MKELLKLLPSLFLIFSCSVNPPVIKEVNWDIKLIKDVEENRVYESLSIFVNILDDDSPEDVKEILLINDKVGLHWELTRDNWVFEDRGEKWYGSNSIIMPDRSSIPRDSMKLFVRDRAGESIETKIYITKSELIPGEYSFPALRFDKERIKLLNSESATIFCYSDLGELLYTGELTGESTFRDLFGEEPTGEEFHFYLIGKDKRQVLESGPFIFTTGDSE